MNARSHLPLSRGDLISWKQKLQGPHFCVSCCSLAVWPSVNHFPRSQFSWFKKRWAQGRVSVSPFLLALLFSAFPVVCDLRGPLDTPDWKLWDLHFRSHLPPISNRWDFLDQQCPWAWAGRGWAGLPGDATAVHLAISVRWPALQSHAFSG